MVVSGLVIVTGGLTEIGVWIGRKVPPASMVPGFPPALTPLTTGRVGLVVPEFGFFGMKVFPVHVLVLGAQVKTE